MTHARTLTLVIAAAAAITATAPADAADLLKPTVGQRISDPDIDCAALGKAQGAVGFDPVIHARDLVPTFEKAIAAVEDGQVAIVDVRVEPGYAAITTAAMLRGTEK